MLPIYFTSIHISVWLHQVDSFPTDGAYPRSQNRGIAPAHIIYTEIVFRHVLYQITCNNNFQTHCEGSMRDDLSGDGNTTTGKQGYSR